MSLTGGGELVARRGAGLTRGHRWCRILSAGGSSLSLRRGSVGGYRGQQERLREYVSGGRAMGL